MHAEAIIFDGDGVIFDTTPLHKRVRQAVAERFGIAEFDFHGNDPARSLLERGLAPERVSEYHDIFEEFELREGVKIFPFSNDVLAKLRERGLLTAIFTNRKARLHNLKMFHGSGLRFDLLHFFMMYEKRPWLKKLNILFHPGFRKHVKPGYILTKHPKPNPAGILPALSKIKHLPNFPESVFYVGDNLVDFQFASSNGFQFIAVLSGATKERSVWESWGAKIIVDDISFIPSLIFKK